MLVLDAISEPVPHRLVRVTGAVRHWTCQQAHHVNIGGLLFPVYGQQFIGWLVLVPGCQEVTLSVDCDQCRLHCQRSVRLLCRPVNGPHCVQPTLLVCANEDGSVPAPPGEDGSRASAARRLWLGCLLLQALIADKLREHFPGRPARTFALRDTVLTQRLRLTRAEAQRLEPRQLWSRVAAELRNTRIDLATTKVLGFLAGPALDGGHVWQGGGGLALCSAACLFSWPRSVPEIVPRFCDGRAAPEWADTSGRGTRWACLSTTLGAAAHELCHALDLGHAEHGLMGRAYDELWRYCVLSTEGATGGLRRPPPELPTVPGVPAGHRCDADCHSCAAPCPPATSDLTFLDAASAALLYHHAWCGAAEGNDGPGTVQISPQLEVVSSRPLRVVVCRTADEEAKLVGLWTLSGEDYRLDLGPWFRGVVVDLREAKSANIGRNTKPTSPDVLEEKLEKPSSNLSDTGVWKQDVTTDIDLPSGRQQRWSSGQEVGDFLGHSVVEVVQEFLILVENDNGGLAKRVYRL
ncbi:uncharacterized protein LOC122389312 [Amphibalanus amphitrite]|uniref:uncharacterized protein LOC122389312 n=1 Tax=Amphibalanus amphitrite TaxID=1232801 RepID=UPI001C9211F6|nr:uncharacterized protein LOC122389312 [Amphibalanus amphitrite]